MKKYLVGLAVAFSIHANAQYFEPIGLGIGIDGVQSNATRVKSILNDTIHHKLLIGGEFLYADSIPVSGGCYWDGNSFHSMIGIGASNITMSSTMWNGYNVFAVDLGVHMFDSTQTIPFNFSPLFFGTDRIFDVISFNDSLYIGGSFYLQDGTHGLAKWNGTVWEGVGGSITGGPIGIIQCLGVYNGDLIAAGTFDSIGGIAANHIARWDGVQWHAMGGGVNADFGSSPHIQCMHEYNGKLYVSGDNLDVPAAFLTGLIEWDGNSWTGPSLFGNIGGSEMKIYHNKLYVGGSIAIYDSMGNSSGGTVLISYDGIVWKNYILWNAPGGMIRAMDTFQNYLFVGGDFDTLGGVYCNKIARFSDDTVLCFPPILETSGDTLFVNETGYFHWINCNDGSIISGATSNTYIPDTAGNYAVIVTSGGCNDTTECVSYLGINELQIEDYKLQLYPNPANETVTITAENIKEIVVSNLLGVQMIRLPSTDYRVNNAITIDISKLPQGIYLLRVQTNNGWRAGKVVKE